MKDEFYYHIPQKLIFIFIQYFI